VQTTPHETSRRIGNGGAAARIAAPKSSDETIQAAKIDKEI